MGKKSWLSMHPGNFGSQMTIRPPARASVPATGIPMKNNSINRYGNPTGTRGFWREIAWPPGRIKRKKQQQCIFPTEF